MAAAKQAGEAQAQPRAAAPAQPAPDTAPAQTAPDAAPAARPELQARVAGEAEVTTLDPNAPETWGQISRNEPCPCGSGLKYKACHGKF
ncbi:SEC-C metal-binding domain-containing protein [Oceanicella sp. SM1341]|uniref:SEC-C metal-binding domain-containing protein n=1 Tax=Oceanicella sp. SM1341 TaxID=1548889 RepID=UPI00351349E3